MSHGRDSRASDDARRLADVHITREGQSYIDLDNPDSVRAILCKADQYSKIKIVTGNQEKTEPA